MPGENATIREPALLRQDRTAQRTSRTQFASLEYLRILASLMIIVFHAHSISQKHATQQGIVYFDLPILWNCCIELFFVMSGFLMIHMSRNLFGSPAGVRNFFLRRVTRTPPLYWIYTIGIAALFIAVPGLSAGGPMDLKTILGSLLFIPMERAPVITIGWTLNYEVFFYTIIAFSIFLPYQAGWKAAVAVIVALVATGYGLGLTSAPWSTWTNPINLNFVIGILVAVAYYAGFTLTRAGRWIAAVIGIALVLSLRRLVDGDLLRVVTMGLGIGCVIAAATLSDKQWSLGRFHSIAHELSNQTYTMYLAHILILKFLEVIYFRLFTGFTSDVGYIVFGTALVVMVSRPLYLGGEKPITAYFRGVLKRWQQPRNALA